MKAVHLALAAVLSIYSGAATAEPTIVSYDILNANVDYSQGSTFYSVGWQFTYNGSVTPDGQSWWGPTVSLSGGSGTLNDGLVPADAVNNQLFITTQAVRPYTDRGIPPADGPVITLYLDAFYTIDFIDLLAGRDAVEGNVIPGNITGAILGINGTSNYYLSQEYGFAPGVVVDNFRSFQPNDRLILNTPQSQIPTDRITISGITTTGINYMFFNIAEISLSGTLARRSAVPEPSSWAMMLLGFGAVGFAMRRKRAGLGRRGCRGEPQLRGIRRGNQPRLTADLRGNIYRDGGLQRRD